MNSAKVEELKNLAEQSAARIAGEAMTFACKAFLIFKDEVINSRTEKALNQPLNEREGNKSVTLPSQKLLIAEEVAELLQVEVKTIYSWANVGKIPSFKVGGCLRFDRQEVLEAARNKIQLSLPEPKPALKETKLRMIK